MKKLTSVKHKAFTQLYDKPAIYYLIKSIIESGIDELIIVLGYDSENLKSYLNSVIGKNPFVQFVYNDKYLYSNNLYSVLCAEKFINYSQFIICNGDLVIDGEIICDFVNCFYENSIVIDDNSKNRVLNSPGIIEKNSKIYDLGRHISTELSGGYAIGLYKIGKNASEEFFLQSNKLITINKDAGFHDPLNYLFSKHPFHTFSTRGREWMDIDCEGDVGLARNMIRRLYKSKTK